MQATKTNNTSCRNFCSPISYVGIAKLQKMEIPQKGRQLPNKCMLCFINAVWISLKLTLSKNTLE